MNFKKLIVVLFLIIAVGFPGMHTSAEEYQIGDIITFGSYEQNNNRQDGPEDLEWIVLEQENDRILVITRACINCMPYHSRLEPVTWESSSLRKWLNEEFIDTAFTEDEKERIISVENKNPDHTFAETDSGRATTDQIFILNMEEANTYFTTYASRQAAPTAYAIAQGAYHNENNQMGWWWLRTTSYYTDHVTYVTSGGDVSSNGREVTRQDAGIRPAMWIRNRLANDGTITQTTVEEEPRIFEESIPRPADKVDFNYINDRNGEYAYIIGMNKENQPIWGYKTPYYKASAQLFSVSDILLHEDRYYFFEAGKIVALDAATGAVVWENSYFTGQCPVGTVDTQGNLYLSGYFSPAFFAIDKAGNILYQIEKLDPNYYWSKRIEAFESYVEITFDKKIGSEENKDYVFRINIDDYSFEFDREVEETLS